MITMAADNDEIQVLKKENRELKLERINLKEENELLKKLLLKRSPSLVHTLPEYDGKIDDELLSALKRSKKKVDILKTLDKGAKAPTMLSKELKIKIVQVSSHLNFFKKEELIACLNEKDNKYRFYALTPKGKKYLELVELE